MSIILSVHARQILDSRGGNPTVEVDVVTENGVMGRQRFLQVLLQESMKPLNCVMAEALLWVKV